MNPNFKMYLICSMMQFYNVVADKAHLDSLNKFDKIYFWSVNLKQNVEVISKQLHHTQHNSTCATLSSRTLHQPPAASHNVGEKTAECQLRTVVALSFWKHSSGEMTCCNQWMLIQPAQVKPNIKSDKWKSSVQPKLRQT